MKNKTLFVGCGGSGITTLLRVNELFAGNPTNRQELRENISYMIFDTSVSETEDFKTNIRKQLGNAGMPFIKTVQVTRNYTNLDEIVKPTFDEFAKRMENPSLSMDEREKARVQLERLKENWWYSPSWYHPDDKAPGIEEPCKSYPFRAQSITDGLNQGAGQCGPVSFLATWNYLPNLQKDIQEIVEAIQIRNTDNQTTGLNVFIVAGTAGGTGRGCWQLIAFKVAQCLRNMGYNCNPIGVLFDSTCFPNVTEGSPNERLNLSINSLTAWSELSAWMMQPVTRSYRFALPYLHNPEICDKKVDGKSIPCKPQEIGLHSAPSDVISVPEDGDNELAPITNAYLIFRENGVATLKNNKQYHEMAAAALYAMVAEDKFIGPGSVNRHECIRSFGAVTFEVATIPIRRYLEALVRKEYSRNLYLKAEERPADLSDAKPELENAYKINDEADMLVGKVGGDYSKLKPEKKPFFARTGFCVDQSAQQIATFQPSIEVNASLLQLLMAKCAEKCLKWKKETGLATIAAEFTAALKTQKKGVADQTIKKVFKLDGFNVNIIEEFLKECKLDDKQLKDTVKATVLNAFASGGMKPSIGRALAVIEKMTKRITDSIKNLSGESEHSSLTIAVDNSTSVCNVDECITKFSKKVADAASKRKFWQFSPFSKSEIASLTRDYQQYLICALFFKIQATLADKFSTAKDELKNLERSMENLVKGIAKVDKVYDAEICEAAGVKGDIKLAYRRLFVDPTDQEAIFKALPEMDSNSNIYRRVLRPIMSQDDVKKLVAGETYDIETPIKDCLERFVRDLIKGDVYASDDDAKEAICSGMSEVISANVSLAYKDGADFMTRHFKFEDVLRLNKQPWEKLLASRIGSSDSMGELKDRLRKFLGISSIEINTEGIPRISEKKLIAGIIASMAGDCKPWMQLSAGARPTYLKAIALLPFGFEREDDVQKIKDEVSDRFMGKTLQVFHTNEERGFSLPKDRIVVYSAMAVTVNGAENPFDFISSLDYWWKFPELKRLLIAAEDDKNLESYFYPIPNNTEAEFKWGEQRDTHGFVSPIFLKVKGLASTRWRPWKKWDGGYDAARQLAKETNDALIYGLLGTGDIPETVKTALQNAGWDSYPLIQKGTTQESLKFTRTCQHDGNAWKVGKDFRTILSLKLFLSGEGRKSYQKEGGKGLDDERMAGNMARENILKEFEAFRTNVVPKVGVTVIKQLTKALEDWLGTRDDDAASNKEEWIALYKYLKGDDKNTDKYSKFVID